MKFLADIRDVTFLAVLLSIFHLHSYHSWCHHGNMLYGNLGELVAYKSNTCFSHCFALKTSTYFFF